MKKKLVASHNTKKRKYKEHEKFVCNNKKLKHMKPSDVLGDLMCQPVNCKGFETYKWKCVLDRCKECPTWVEATTSPNGHEEANDTSSNHMMHYEQYEKVYRCALHQRIDSNVCFSHVPSFSRKNLHLVKQEECAQIGQAHATNFSHRKLHDHQLEVSFSTSFVESEKHHEIYTTSFLIGLISSTTTMTPLPKESVSDRRFSNMLSVIQ